MLGAEVAGIAEGFGVPNISPAAGALPVLPPNRLGVDVPEVGFEDGLTPKIDGCEDPPVAPPPNKFDVGVLLVFPNKPPPGCEVAGVLWPKVADVPGVEDPPLPNKPVEVVCAGFEDCPKRLFELPLPAPPVFPPKLNAIIALVEGQFV